MKHNQRKNAVQQGEATFRRAIELMKRGVYKSFEKAVSVSKKKAK